MQDSQPSIHSYLPFYATEEGKKLLREKETFFVLGLLSLVGTPTAAAEAALLINQYHLGVWPKALLISSAFMLTIATLIFFSFFNESNKVSSDSVKQDNISDQITSILFAYKIAKNRINKELKKCTELKQTIDREIGNIGTKSAKDEKTIYHHLYQVVKREVKAAKENALSPYMLSINDTEDKDLKAVSNFWRGDTSSFFDTEDKDLKAVSNKPEWLGYFRALFAVTTLLLALGAGLAIGAASNYFAGTGLLAATLFSAILAYSIHRTLNSTYQSYDKFETLFEQMKWDEIDRSSMSIS